MKAKGNILIWVVVLALLFTVSYVLYNNSEKSKKQIENRTDDKKDVNNNTTQSSSPNADAKNSATPDKSADTSNSQEQKGEMAPDFTLKDLDGNTVKLSDYRGKVVFVNFWATWCPPCRGEMPDFDKVNRDLQKSGDAVILAVNITDGYRGENEEKVRKFIADSGYSLHVLLDEGGNVSYKDYNVRAIPSTFVVDKDGSLYTYIDKEGNKYKYFEGPIDEDMLLEIIRKTTGK